MEFIPRLAWFFVLKLKDFSPFKLWSLIKCFIFCIGRKPCFIKHRMKCPIKDFLFNLWQSENGHLQELIETLRERQKKTTNDRLQDVEKENKKLMDSNIQLQSQVVHRPLSPL